MPISITSHIYFFDGLILICILPFSLSRPGMQDRHITVIYNPFGGGGKAKHLVAHMVVPVLQLAKLRFTVMSTKYRCHAIRIVKELDVRTIRTNHYPTGVWLNREPWWCGYHAVSLP